MSNIRMTRRVSFSSGHRYWLERLSPEENRTLFGPYASRFNHGHNYVLDVTVEGAVNPVHGMVVNIKDIDAILQDHLVCRFDQKSINDEVSGFDQTPPCIENLLSAFRSTITALLPPEVQLTGLKLEEMPLLYGEWSRDSAMTTITRVYEFAASHRLHCPELPHEENLALFGKCNNPMGHGHNYLLEVTVTGEPHPVTGFITDIGALDHATNQLVVDRYDHKNLNTDVPELLGKNPTSEVVAEAIFHQLINKVPGKLVRIRLHETARNIFEVSA